MDSAPLKNFLAGLLQRKGPPKVNGRPRKPMTLAQTAPLPRGFQTKAPVKTKLPPLPQMPGKM